MPNKLSEMRHTIHVVVNPQGEIIGPIGTPEFVKRALIIGYKRLTNGKSSNKEIWDAISKMGYKVYKAELVLIEEIDK